MVNQRLILFRRYAVVVFFWLVSIVLSVSGVTSAIDRNVFDFNANLVPVEQSDQNVQIVAIDPTSFQEIGAPWPWPRNLHADFINAASRAGAKVIVFDIVFDAESEADPVFANAIKAQGKVVLAAERSAIDTGYAVVETLVGPNPILNAAAAGVGVANVPLEEDGRLRRMPSDANALIYQTAHLLDFDDNEPARERGFIRFGHSNESSAPISYYQVLDAENLLPENALQGKILIVGLALPANPDVKSFVGDEILLPSYAGGSRPGVYAHAEALKSLLGQYYFRATPKLVEIFLIGIAMAGSFVVTAIAPRRLPAAISMLGVGLLTVIGFSYFGLLFGWVVSIGLPLLGSGLAGGAAVLQSGLTAFLSRRRLEARFGKYVAPEIMRRMVDDPEGPALGGEEREVSILVTDLEGFTSFMAQHSPADGAEILRDYLDRLGAVVLQHGGMIDQFIGDSIVVVFNAPLDQANHQQKALDCALALEKEGTQFAKQMSQRGIAFGVTRVGGHCGPAIVGNFGSKDRFHYTAMGDVVNTASRLEGACKALAVNCLVSAELLRQAGGSQSFAKIGPLLLDGLQNPLQAAAAVDHWTEKEKLGFKKAHVLASAQAAIGDVKSALVDCDLEDPLIARLLKQVSDGVFNVAQAISKMP